MDKSDTSIWWASKEFKEDKKLSDYIGTNEKTKIVAKIQKVSSLLKLARNTLFLC